MIVGDEGPRGARIVLVGDYVGRHEAEQGRPWVGPASQLLMRWLAECGLRREDLYLTNVFRGRPAGKKFTPRELAPHVNELHERLALLDDPYVLVACSVPSGGSLALQALTGHANILRHRGSIYSYVDRRGRTIKVIPTINPAAVLWKYAREWAGAPQEQAAGKTKDYEERCKLDWVRIKSDSEFRELRVPQREYIIDPTAADRRDFLREAAHARVLALDIETPREVTWEPTEKVSKRCTCGHAQAKHTYGEVWTCTATSGRGKTKAHCACKCFAPVTTSGKAKRIDGDRYLDLVGFSDRPDRALVLDTSQLDTIRALCALPVPKVLQNGLFDTWWLEEYESPVARYVYDTLHMHHCLHPAGDHDLAYLASIDTREPYWKDDAKTIDSEVRRAGGAEAIYRTYNGKDACVTRELFDVYAERLRTTGKAAFYQRHYAALHLSLLHMSRTGIRVDAEARTSAITSLRERAASLITGIEEYAGASLRGAKGSLSGVKVKKYLYETMALPKQLRKRASGKRTVSTDAAVLRKLALQFPLRVGPFVEQVLEHEQLVKLTQFLGDAKVDPDGRSRCRYKLTTDTLRLSSSKNPAGRGMNHQNIPVRHGPVIRNTYVPDSGHVLVQLDLSQAESRVVYILTDDPELHAIARSAPWEYDQHCRSLSVIFGSRDERARTYEDALAWVRSGDPEAETRRHLAKRGGHGAHYGLAETKLQEVLLNDGYVYTAIECRQMIDAYFAGTPAVLAWQERVRHRVLYEGVLTTTWGWEWDFGAELRAPGADKQEVYRRAYASGPQNEVVLIVLHWGLEPLDAMITSQRWRSRILQQGHDSLLISCPPEEAWDLYQFTRERLERPRRYAGRELTIPVDVTLGTRWGAMQKFKRPPERAEFEERIAQMLAKQRAA